MPQPRAVLFDADHTLLDTDRAERLALEAAFARLALPFGPTTLAAYRRINSGLWHLYTQGGIDARTLALERFRRLLAERRLDPERAAALGEAYLAALSQRGDLLPWCRRTLGRLGRRYRLGVVTNGYDRVQRSRLEAARLTPFFGVVVTSEACGFTKPDPRILGVALTALGLRPSQALYVGDDPRTDGVAASAAGVPFCWIDRGLPVPPGVPRPRRRVSSLAELGEALAPTG